MNTLLRQTLSIFALLAAAVSAPRAQAFIIGSLSPSVTPTQEVRVIVIGRGKEMGRQFAKAAMGKAFRLREFDSTRPVVIISIREDGNSSDKTFFQRFGVNLFRFDDSLLSGKVLVQELKKLGPIASLEFYSHSGWEVGPGLEGGDYRFNLGTDDVESLGARFTRNAYVMIHGCNSGYKIAPGLSKMWNGIPVAGSLTATDFQQFHTDNVWYHQNPGEYPSRGDWASSNQTTYESLVSCNEPTNPCYRMKPDNSPYSGVWGVFKTGLGFYKWSCANGEDDTCRRGVREAVLSSVSVLPGRESSSFEEYKTLTKDWMCANSAFGTERNECLANIDQAYATGNSTYTSFRGNSLDCSLTGCAYEYDCTNVMHPMFRFRTQEVCGMRNTSSRRSTAFMDDYGLMLRAFDAR